MVSFPSPALAFVGRHNSGKTTLTVKVIAELAARGHDVGSVKHHGHAGFDIDIPGKDSYRQRHAGATESVIAAPGQVACIKTIEGEAECSEIVASMPGHDIVIVEGYRKSGLPTIEVMRASNEADLQVAKVFIDCARKGLPLGIDFTQTSRRGELQEYISGLDNQEAKEKMLSNMTVAVATDIPEVHQAAEMYGIPSFDINDESKLCDFIEANYLRPRVTVAIQAGGASKRMGQSKAMVPFNGRPLVSRMVERLNNVADEILITTHGHDDLSFLHDEFPDVNIRIVCDTEEYGGALPGIRTALQAASNPFVALVACDMVFASSNLIVAEAIRLVESGADVAIPTNKHGYEPFHALYRKEVCLPAVNKRLDEGSRRAQSILDLVSVQEITRDQMEKIEPQGGCFLNANTPDELHVFERMAVQFD